MSEETFTCENCKQTFSSDWSDEEAQAEYEALFPNHAEAEALVSVVCEDCYNKMLDWKSPEEAEKELNQ